MKSIIRKIVIIGGKLQGIEAAYLGKKAGMFVTLVDRDPNAVAQNLCDVFICSDVLSDGSLALSVLDEADMILPATEDHKTLKRLASLCSERGYPLAFDFEAYKTTSSKILSDRLFEDHGMPAPRRYPGGSAPYILKPDGGSGSVGVRILRDEREIYDATKQSGRYVVQEYIEGPSYSVEVIGMPGNYRTYDIVRTYMDDKYDCYKVAVLRDLPHEKESRIRELGVRIADIIKLKGIMDLEVIEHEGEMKIIEIDARFPSQTPIAVFHASGMNYMEELYDLYTTGDFNCELTNTMEFSSVMHFLVSSKGRSARGEHIMTEGGPLSMSALMVGERHAESEKNAQIRAAEIISDRDSVFGRSGDWRGMFINKGAGLDELKTQEQNVCERIETVQVEEKE